MGNRPVAKAGAGGERGMDIDAVITWVDGSDPAHRQRLHDYLADLGARPPTADATRFNDAGELEYCITSILRYAPWFRTLYIVTDAQTPTLLGKLAGTAFADRVQLVDHRQVFAGYEHHLPTFNSRAIISVLWRIPGLAEHFVYFNDDFMLLQPVQPTDFFRGDAVVMRGRWRTQSRFRWTRRVADRFKRLRGDTADKAGNHQAQELSAQLAGFDRRYYRLYHNPFPFRRSTLQSFFAKHPKLFEGNIAHRLRSPQQFKAESVAAHLEISQDNAVFDNGLRVAQVKPSEQAPWRLQAKLRQADREASIAFVCVQSLELAADALRKTIIDWLDRRIGRLDALLDRLKTS